MGKQAYSSQDYARTLIEYPEITDIFEMQISFLDTSIFSERNCYLLPSHI